MTDRILIAEDNPAIAASVAYSLRAGGLSLDLERHPADPVGT